MIWSPCKMFIPDLLRKRRCRRAFCAIPSRRAEVYRRYFHTDHSAASDAGTESTPLSTRDLKVASDKHIHVHRSQWRTCQRGEKGVQYTCCIPDVPGLHSQCSAAQSEAVGPFPTAPPSGLQQFFRVIVSKKKRKNIVFVEEVKIQGVEPDIWWPWPDLIPPISLSPTHDTWYHIELQTYTCAEIRLHKLILFCISSWCDSYDVLLDLPSAVRIDYSWASFPTTCKDMNDDWLGQSCSVPCLLTYQISWSWL